MLFRFWLMVVQSKKERAATYVSIGAFERGPIAPETRPRTSVWYEGSSPDSVYCGWYLRHSFLNSW